MPFELSPVDCAAAPAPLRDALRHAEVGDADFPVPDHTTTRLIELGARPDTAPAEMVAVLRRDLALAAHVLAVANSAAFPARVPSASLEDAVQRLGQRRVAELAVGLLAKAGPFRARGRFRGALQATWTRSAVAGVYAQRIGLLLGRPDGGSLLDGLLHDVGRPLVYALLTGLAAEPELGELLDDSAAEALADALSPTLGAEVARRWHLPEEVCAAIRYRECCSEAGRHADGARIANLAVHLARWALDPDSRAGRDLRDLPVARELGLPEEHLGALFAMESEVRDAAALFG